MMAVPARMMAVPSQTMAVPARMMAVPSQTMAVAARMMAVPSPSGRGMLPSRAAAT
jgi:hypothetical protein